METLAVMKALVKALELVRQTAGRIKAVAIYTDSTSALSIANRPNDALGRIIIEKARFLAQLGIKVSLHWCPGHSKVRSEFGVCIFYRKHDT
jgi:ribonuclease HI